MRGLLVQDTDRRNAETVAESFANAVDGVALVEGSLPPDQGMPRRDVM